METLYEKIVGIEQEQWDYNYCDPNLRMSPHNFEYKDQRNFIKEFIGKAGKANLLESPLSVKDVSLNRSKHIVSTFFLGILIYQKTKIKEYLSLGKNPPKYKIFPFLWFLTCLFHDIGYHYEENSQKYFKSMLNIDSIKNKFNVEYDLLTQNIENIPKDIFQCINNYFLFKREIYKMLDHGIIAGINFFDKLEKNRLCRHKKLEEGRNDTELWGSYLDSQYALASAIIAIHNIWLPKKEDEEIYRSYNLDNLINRKIYLQEAPLLFLLGLVDTIDPVKLFCKKEENVKDVLNGILIDFVNDKIKLGISCDSNLCFAELYRKCKELEDWLDVKVECENNLISIKL